ncbi:MAG: hypothetical protein QNK23_13795 [Crocinitomicaceae bacterium]|nr:hypothetical protein [Crocinitomicaceae bacterium]
MAELHNIVGAILRDIAQARVTSDLYSREVSRYYEEDSLLRLFPIPRTEIKEVEIDLLFGIKEVKKDQNREQDKLVYVSRILERYSEKLVVGIFEGLRGSDNRRKISKSTQWQEQIDLLDTINGRSGLRFNISAFFETNKELLTEKISDLQSANPDEVHYDLNVKEAKEGLSDIVKSTLLNSGEINSLIESEQLEDSYTSSLSVELLDVLSAMDNDLNFEVEAYQLEVTVESEELLALPESMLSKIKITTEIKNYTWSQVEEKDNQIVRRLIPE